MQLSEAMHTVSGTLRPTAMLWLLVLSHIVPQLCRTEATAILLAKIRMSDSLPLHSDIETQSHPPAHLPSSSFLVANS